MSERWVTLCGYGSLIEAQIVRGRLEAAGIAALVPDSLSGGIVGELIGGSGGIRVQVRASDFEEALEVLELGPSGSSNTAAGAAARGRQDARQRGPARDLGPGDRQHTGSHRQTEAPRHCPACGTPIERASSLVIRRFGAWSRAALGLAPRCPGCARDLRDFA